MPKQIYTSLILICALLGSFYFTKAQQIDSMLNIHRRSDPQEKIYVHFDKNYYNPGETIWFKAYLFAGIELSMFSKNFYAELVDEGGNIIDQKTAPVIGSGAASHFDLPATFTKSTIYFRAYTATMLNGDTSFLYTKPIRVLVPVVAGKVKAPTAAVIKFMPEGGDWISGVKNVLAFKVTDAFDTPLEATGTIKDNAGTKLVDFATIHNGMGRVEANPEPGKTYTAFWKDEKGRSYTTALPAFKPQGVELQLTDVDGGKRFTIQRSEEVPEEMKSLHLVGYMNQHLAYSANVNLFQKTLTTAILPTKDLPSGILQLTLFDKNYKPIAERVSFINNHDYEFDADAWVSQKNLAKRGLNTVEVQMSDTIASNLSISVTDADLNDGETFQDNLISHLLLTADLRGKIVNPYYYFFSTSDSVAYHLDLVMLTHGWRKYNWEQVLAGTKPAPKWAETDYLSLNGSVASNSAGGFAPGTELTGILKTADSLSSFMVLPVTKKGKVFTDGLLFYDYAKLYFQFNNKKIDFDKSMLTLDNGLRKGYKIAMLDSSDKIESLTVDPDIAAKNIRNNINELRVATQRNQKVHELQNVTVTAKVKDPMQKLDEKYSSGMFGGDALKFDLVNDPAAASSLSVFQYLQGRVAGLQISMGGGTPTLSWRGGSPSLFLNEMNTDADQLSNTPMSDIAYIKVFRPGSTGVIANSGGGAIVVYTKKGGDVTMPAGKGLDYVQLTGYSPVKQFYSPDYATSSAVNDLDDLRTTLYWNPVIFLQKSRKKFRFQFYNSDITKHFRIVMEGVNDEGKLFHVEKIIE